MVRIIAAIFAAALLTGCATSGTKVTQAQAAQFTKGQSTEADVIARLGPPTRTSKLPDGAWQDIYAYSRAEPRAESFIPYVNLLVGGSDSTTTMVSFRFGPDGKLQDWSSAASNSAFNAGLLNQKER
jgi:outer membrane protein assembly factor BamE (lipoprotein component of BamABCDE complex)